MWQPLTYLLVLIAAAFLAGAIYANTWFERITYVLTVALMLTVSTITLRLSLGGPTEPICASGICNHGGIIREGPTP